MNKNHIVFILMDSCRYDSLVAASTPNNDRIGPAEKRYSYASWTAPSHYTFTMGMLPHASPKDVFASEVYKDEFAQWKERTGSADVSFKDFLPEISLPKVLSNLGETHYPYMLSDDNLPHISGVHGALKSMGDGVGGPHRIDESFDLEQLKGLHQQQVKCVEYIDGVLGKLMQKAPANTHFIVTADHGELFGQDGYFGHGPIMHEKCFEIPYVEGKVKEAAPTA